MKVKNHQKALLIKSYLMLVFIICYLRSFNELLVESIKFAFQVVILKYIIEFLFSKKISLIMILILTRTLSRL